MLAIIIPFYKLTFFEATLQSLAHQSDKRFKVYIGDDASPEDCTTLLQKFEGKFYFIYHRFETNLGGTSLTQQWERCIALSNNEEWLMVLGDDDVLDNNVVEEFYKLIEKNTFDISLIRFNHRVIDERIDFASVIAGRILICEFKQKITIIFHFVVDVLQCIAHKICFHYAVCLYF